MARMTTSRTSSRVVVSGPVDATVVVADAGRVFGCATWAAASFPAPSGCAFGNVGARDVADVVVGAVAGVVVGSADLSRAASAAPLRPCASFAKPACAATRDRYGDTAIGGRILPVVATGGFCQHWSSNDAAHV